MRQRPLVPAACLFVPAACAVHCFPNVPSIGLRRGGGLPHKVPFWSITIRQDLHEHPESSGHCAGHKGDSFPTFQEPWTLGLVWYTTVILVPGKLSHSILGSILTWATQ